jgi:hypothetical protein
VRAYDSMGNETPQGAPKVILRAYDVPHDAFGGVTTLYTTEEQVLAGSEYLAKGHAIASAYSRAFLRYHVLGRDSQEYVDYFSYRDFPPEVVEPSWWDYLVGYDQLPRGLDCGSLSEDGCWATQGCVFAGPDCEPVSCVGLGELNCKATRGCAFDGTDCHNQPVILGAWVDPRLPPGRRATIDTFQGGMLLSDTNLIGPGPFAEWELGTVIELNRGACDPEVGQPMECENEDTRAFFGTGHRTSGLRLRSEGVADGYVQWSLEGLPNRPAGPFDATGFTHVRMRAGVRSRLLADNPAEAEDCALVDTSPWALAIELTSTDGIVYAKRAVNVRPLIQQDVSWSATGSTGAICAGDFFMQTIEVSFAELSDGLGTGIFIPSQLTALEVQLPATNGPGEVIIDSIELVREPNASASSYPIESGMFACEARGNLLIKETSCTEEPINGACPSAAIVTTPVDPPEVPAQWGGPFEGFVVHGWAEDVQAPTSAELAAIAARCVIACEQFYVDDPHVSATCSASGAFQVPTLLSTDSTPSIPRIPDEVEDGDLALLQSLSCNLESSCCESFSEDVCAATPTRPTPAPFPLGTGEKWRLGLQGTMTVMSLDDQVPQAVGVTGTMGSSQCAEGNAVEPCPFYVGSLHVELAQSLSMEVDCGGTPVAFPLDALEIDLLQPAMGMDLPADDTKVFPRGALHLRTHVEVGTFSFDHVEANQTKLYIDEGGDWMSADGGDGLEVYFGVPCNGQLEPMIAWLVLADASVTGSPPSASIDMPSSVGCGTSVDLDVDASDPDDDIARVRWEVDGVLLDDSLDSIEINAAHEIRVIVRDARGATTTDTHAITCTVL